MNSGMPHETVGSVFFSQIILLSLINSLTIYEMLPILAQRPAVAEEESRNKMTARRTGRVGRRTQRQRRTPEIVEQGPYREKTVPQAQKLNIVRDNTLM